MQASQSPLNPASAGAVSHHSSEHNHGDHDHGHHGHGSHNHGDHSHGDHSHGHGGHAHSHAPDSLRALVAVIAFTTVIFLAEVIFGLLSHSLALLADAAHMLSDSAGLVVALVAMLIGRRQATAQATYGYRRIEVISAAVNATAIGLISIWIVVEAVQRLNDDSHIDTTMMLTVAVIGLIANTASALILVRRQHDSMNMRGAYLHVLSDMVGSAAVIIAGLIVRYTGFVPADTIASIVIAVIIFPRSYKLLKDALRVLMEQVPTHIDLDEIRAGLETIDTVEKVHDLHVWSTDGNELIATCHLVISECDGDLTHCGVLDDAAKLFTSLGIGHCTVQLESSSHEDHEPESHD